MEKKQPTENYLIEFIQFLARLWVIVAAVIGSFVILGVALLFTSLRGTSNEVPQHRASQKIIHQGSKDKVAVIHLDGQIVGGDEEGGIGGANVASAPRLISLLEQTQIDKDVKAVIIRINSPGGAVVASDEVYRKVREVRKTKPVVAVMDDLAASGGYYIAVGADKIVANPATITGSIGVIAEFPELSGLFQKIGVEMRTFKSGQYKDIGSAYRELTPDEKTIIDHLINESYDQFVSAIAEGRKMDPARVRQLGDGRIYTGKQAQENGLIDTLGTFDDGIKEAENLSHVSDATVVEYSNESFWESILESKLPNFSLNANVADQVLPKKKFGMYYLLSF